MSEYLYTITRHGQATQATSGTLGKSLMPQNHASRISRHPRSCEASGTQGPCLLQSETAERTPAMTKQQTGYLFHRGQSWHLRYYDTDATGQRVQKCEKLEVPRSGEYKTRSSVQPFVDKILKPLNGGMLVPQSTMRVSEFIEKVYLVEHVEKKLRPASRKQYNDIWDNHLKASMGDISLRKFRTFNGQAIMDKLAAKGTLGHSSLCHAKAFLSGTFKEALRRGYLEGYSGEKHEHANPMQNVEVPGTERKRKPKSYYTLREIMTMLDFLPEPARTVVLVAAFTGLRKSELRGLAWADFSRRELNVNRSVWGTKKLAKKLDPGSSAWGGVASAPKTEASNAPIPLTDEVVEALEAHRLRSGILAQPDLPIFQAGNGQPLNLDNLARRIIAPVAAWKGWHGFRRGLATNLHDAGEKDKDIQGIMRHSDLRTTMNIYVQSVPKSRVAAIKNLGETFANMQQHATEQSDTVN